MEGLALRLREVAVHLTRSYIGAINATLAPSTHTLSGEGKGGSRYCYPPGLEPER